MSTAVGGPGRDSRWLVFALFGISGLAVGYAAYLPLPSYTAQLALKAGVPAIFATTAWRLHRSARLHRYWKLPYAFFAAALGVLIAWFIGNAPLRLLGLTSATFAGMAVAKISEALPIIVTILALIRFAGDGWGTLYLRRGRLGFGVVVGAASFAGFAIVAYSQAVDLGLGVETLLAGLPWMLLFALFNAFMEELWFRGLFLGRLEPFLGPWISLVATSLVFTLVHLSILYYSGAELARFLVVLFLLALLWGLIMQKTRSMLASVLFHAGGDLVILVGFMAER